MSSIVNYAISPKVPRPIFLSVITQPLVIVLYIEVDFNEQSSRVLPGAPTAAYVAFKSEAIDCAFSLEIVISF